MFDPKLKEALGRVQKPGRYTGGEPGSVYKDKEKVDVRFAFCFPDTYEVGMSFLGEKILYELLNRRENWWWQRNGRYDRRTSQAESGSYSPGIAGQDERE